jgi:hypothetical protein
MVTNKKTEPDGNELEDWRQAEAEIEARMKAATQ